MFGLSSVFAGNLGCALTELQLTHFPEAFLFMWQRQKCVTDTAAQHDSEKLGFLRSETISP